MEGKDAVKLEHRLTKLESATIAMREKMESGFDLLTGKAERQQGVMDKILVQTTATNSRVTKLEDRPVFASPITPQEAEELVAQHRDIWTVWRFSRWFIPLSIPIVIFLATLTLELLVRFL